MFRRVVFLSLLSLPVFAQNTAALGGTIQDSTGAVVPRAGVKLTSHEQGTVRTAESNQTGLYSFSFLPRGVYDIEVTATGFRTLSDKNITLSTAESIRRDYTIEVGNVSDNMTVSANAQTVNTDNAEMGAVLDNTKVTEMPLNGRTFYSLASLTPGATAPLNNQGFRGAFSVAGASQVSNNFTLNGMDNNDPTIAIPNFRPSIDAIQEFNILTGIYPAQYGLGSGGQIIVSTKSGTNNLHGSAYEFLRNSYMDALNFFSAPGTLPAFKRNQFGSTIGGPIKKNKLFFVHSYEGLRLSQAQTALTTVPTTAMVNGDFSSLLSLARPILIKDPTSPNGAVFAGNVIPSNRFSRIARDLFSYYPAPTFATATGAQPGFNYLFNVPRPERYMQHSVKVDYTVSQKDSAYLTLNYYKDTSVETGTGSTCNNTTLPKFPCDLAITNQVYGLSETHIFSPSLVNEARVAYTHTYTPSSARNGNIDFWGPYGVKPLLVTFSKLPSKGLPALNLTGYNAFSSSRSFLRADPHTQWTDTVSLTHGRHTVKIGFNYLHYKTGNLDLSSQGGTLTFNNTSQGPTTTYGVADMLLGYPATSANTPYRYQNYGNLTNVSAFIQDDFKVNSKLTLNIGLRWEMNTPLRDDGNRLTNFNPGTGQAITQSHPSPDAPFSNPAAPIGFGEHPYHFDWHDYAPRFGFAWQPFGDGKTVIRGGTGTFYTTYSLNNALGGLFAGYPYQTTYTYTSSTSAAVLLSNPFPGGGTNATTSNSLTGAEQNFRNAVTYQWSLGIQRQVAKDLIAEATYFAYQASHQQGTHDINQPLPGLGTPAAVQARRPYPAFGAISMYQWDRTASFHSLQTKLQKKYSNGLSFLATYMWSHEIDDQGTPPNQRDFRTTRGSGTIDTRHRFVISPVYELPFGKGKQFLSHGIVAAIAGGWQIAPLVQWQTGNPLTATMTGNFSNSGGTTDRPDLVADPNANAPHTPQQWFNVKAFDATRAASGGSTATYSFGNAGKGVIVSPGLVGTDLSIVRTFRLNEKGWRVQLRGEFFNALNHTNFNFPTLVANTTSTFGSISSAQDPRQIQVALKINF